VLEEQIRALRQRPAGPARRGAAAPPPAEAPRVASAEAEAARPSPLERTFVAVLLYDPELGAELVGRFPPDQFDHPVVARIVAGAAELAAAGALRPEALVRALEEDARAYALLGELSVSAEFSVGIERAAEDCTTGMERRTLEREMRRVMQEMKKANARGDAAQVREFVRRRGELARGIEALRAPRNPADSR
jgi:hypothetical protein